MFLVLAEAQYVDSRASVGGGYHAQTQQQFNFQSQIHGILCQLIERQEHSLGPQILGHNPTPLIQLRRATFDAYVNVCRHSLSAMQELFRNFPNSRTAVVFCECVKVVKIDFRSVAERRRPEIVHVFSIAFISFNE